MASKKATERVSECRWYIEPRGKYSNSVVAQHMAPHGIAEANAQPAVQCQDGKVHGLWECPRDVIDAFEQSLDSEFKFRIWVSKGRGKPYPWIKCKSQPRLPKKKVAKKAA
ncbi:MAG: hypothetical protein KBB55_00400 [Candidatus Buchananbacteria bacterium]|nr:hypothetical protein [Candidatus Buchananbacteria bacterium]